MEIKPITLEDMLEICHINYDGVEEEVIRIAGESKSLVEFYEKFHVYFTENGLGADDCWDFCERYLGLMLICPYR